MKITKKILLTIAMTMALGTSAFAASGFEFILNVPLGIGIGIPTKTEKNSFVESVKVGSGVGFDGGVTAQLGYMISVSDGFGISVLGELGYAHSTRSLTIKSEEAGVKMTSSITYSFESLQIGLLPKFNIGAFAIGIGGGVKIPMAGQLWQKLKVGDAEIFNTKDKLKMKDIKDEYSPAVIGYIKGTFDYSIFFTDNLAFNIGLYLEYDMLKTKAVPATEFDAEQKSEMQGIFDIGIELGLKFGPKA